MINQGFIAASCLAFWLQGLFFGWETFLYIALISIGLLFTKKVIRPSTVVIVSFGLYASGYAFHLFWSGTDASVLAFAQVVLVGGFVCLFSAALSSRIEAERWYKALFWNVVVLALYGWLIKGDELLQSVFGYANMLAAVCLFGLFFGVHGFFASSRSFKWAYGLGIVVLLVSLAATEARIAWALAVIGLAVQLAYEQKIRARTILTGIGALGGALLLAAIARPDVSHSLLQVSSLRLRLTYYWDALRYLLENPVIAAGPGVWEHLQYQYQTALYSVVHVHNHFLQTWLDGGLLSMLGLVLFAAILSWDVKAVRHVEKDAKGFFISVWLSTASVLAYGALDFILSFPALLAVVCCYGIVRSQFFGVPQVVHLHRFRYPIVVMAIFLILLAGFGFYRESNLLQAETALRHGELRTALKLEDLPVWATSLESRSKLLGNAYMEKARRTNRREDWEAAVRHLQTAMQANPQSLHAHSSCLYALFQLGRYEECVILAEELVRRQPALVKNYENYAYALRKSGRHEEANRIPDRMSMYKQHILQSALFPRHIPALRPTDIRSGS